MHMCIYIKKKLKNKLMNKGCEIGPTIYDRLKKQRNNICIKNENRVVQVRLQELFGLNSTVEPGWSASNVSMARA